MALPAKAAAAGARRRRPRRRSPRSSTVAEAGGVLSRLAREPGLAPAPERELRRGVGVGVEPNTCRAHELETVFVVRHLAFLAWTRAGARP